MSDSCVLISDCSNSWKASPQGMHFTRAFTITCVSFSLLAYSNSLFTGRYLFSTGVNQSENYWSISI